MAQLRIISSSVTGDYTIDLTGFGLSPDGDIRLSVPNNNIRLRLLHRAPVAWIILHNAVY
jgi:hypothetical protein